MKYIIISILVDGDEQQIPYIFHRLVQHNQFATHVLVHHRLKGNTFGYFEGAGFVCLDDCGKLECYGKSISLNVNSNKYDSTIVNQFFSLDDYNHISTLVHEQDIFNYYHL